VNTAETPFEFVTVSYLTRIGNQSAGTLAELLTGLENCSDASIFHHTYQTLAAITFSRGFFPTISRNGSFGHQPERPGGAVSGTRHTRLHFHRGAAT